MLRDMPPAMTLRAIALAALLVLLPGSQPTNFARCCYPNSCCAHGRAGGFLGFPPAPAGPYFGHGQDPAAAPTNAHAVQRRFLTFHAPGPVSPLSGASLWSGLL